MLDGKTTADERTSYARLADGQERLWGQCERGLDLSFLWYIQLWHREVLHSVWPGFGLEVLIRRLTLPCGPKESIRPPPMK